MQTNFVYTMANKPLQFILTERKLNVGKAGEKTVQIAQPTGRHRVDFRNFGSVENFPTFFLLSQNIGLCRQAMEVYTKKNRCKTLILQRLANF